ncbi:mannitol dehydrogenase family protein [Cellulomonas aerilata]|uniref:Mannitol-1-phosphate 5-dehydrogenase n=1 Tax=Cellulomonas aerilata TaxID=515326 RepID=A0A512D8L3_9CELL|nr:mannitol dehydrogenase family protein [Cellulomonas aerilata]GEO32735.1 mannitol dehydrogenase [Cellulomonas aerilata]
MTTPDSLPRLSLATLGLLPTGDAVHGPSVDPRAATVGIVHLGVGAFHRAHQAVFTEEAAAAADETTWGILGVTGRSPRVAEQLVPQDGLYGVLTKGRGTTSLRVVGSMRGAASLTGDSERVLAAIAAPSTHIVSSTVSEKGYRRAATGNSDVADPDLAADVGALTAELTGGSAGAACRTPVGALVRGLARRHRDHGAPLTVVCCDNMTDNGRVVERLVHGIIDAVPGREAAVLRAWVQDSVRFPVSMVDRITPATTDTHRTEAQALSGLRDEALVVAEPFLQWVIEDLFAGPRPRWELVPGATITDDVAPYERAKLRMLNGTHSTVAYLGALRGHRLIDQAVVDPEVGELARRLLDEDVIPTLTPPAGLDLARYRDDILERFANPSTGYTTLQVAADGSLKVPIRLLSVIADRLEAGVVADAAIRSVAGWLAFVARGRDVDGGTLPLEDPIADRLRAAAAGSAGGLVDRMLELEDVFPEAVREHDGVRTALRAEVADLLRMVPAG